VSIASGARVGPIRRLIAFGQAVDVRSWTFILGLR